MSARGPYSLHQEWGLCRLYYIGFESIPVWPAKYTRRPGCVDLGRQDDAVARAWYVCDARHLGLGWGGCTQNTPQAEQARLTKLLDLLEC